ncbi:MAG: hypothetical protein M3Y82_00090 [Verrucomicrobiota bacterium]|nr:hypothetical protein [Verrucomicrobiota bacterium]
MNSNRFLASIAAIAVILLTNSSAYAAFHTWKVNEIYSNADGSVQFIEMKEASGFNGQNLLSGHSITCTGPAGTTTFNFSNLASSTTANKFFLIGTSNLVSVPGGLTPDFVFTNPGPFLSLNSGSINFAGVDVITYTNLPANGSGAITRSGSTLIATTNNSPVNFGGASNSIVPVRFLYNARSGNDFVVTFATATGTNGTAGPNYALQTTNVLCGINWNTVTNLTGNGAVRTITNSINANGNLFFRLRVP